MIDLAVIISFIAGMVSVMVLVPNLKKIFDKNFGVLEKTEVLELRELGIKKKEEITLYADYIRAENEIAKLAIETKRYLYIMGTTLSGLFLREYSNFLETLEDLARRNIYIKILLLHPESKSLEEYKSDDIWETLNRIAQIQKNGGKLEVRLTKEVPSTIMIFNESVSLLGIYSVTREGKSVPMMLIKDKELMLTLRENFEHVWQNSESIKKMQEEVGLGFNI